GSGCFGVSSTGLYGSAAADDAGAAGYHIQARSSRFVPATGDNVSTVVASFQSETTRPTANGPEGVGRVIEVRCSIHNAATAQTMMPLSNRAILRVFPEFRVRGDKEQGPLRPLTLR